MFGDPFALPEPVPGHYQTFKGKGLVQAMRTNFDEGSATRNTAAPNIVDFYCDVDRVLSNELTQEEQDKFFFVYLDETDLNAFTDQERAKIELRIGRALRQRGVSPVRRYFTSIRRSQGK